MMDALKQFWTERAPRERMILGVGGAVLLLVAALSGADRAGLERNRPPRTLAAAAARPAAELDALLGEVKALKSRPAVATVSPSEVKGAIETSLARAGLKTARIVPLSDGDMQLTFANVPYGTWATWLAGIERELGARTTSLVVTGKDATPGNVDAELALRLARK